MMSKSNLGVNHVFHVSTLGPEKFSGIRDSRMKAQYHGYVARAHDLKCVHTTYKHMYNALWFMSNEHAEFVSSLLSVY